MSEARDSGRPAGYTSKLNITLDGAMRADAALRVILRRLLQTLQDNVEGTRRGLDPECLHDLRVAVRRARSCLSQLKKVFPREDVEPLRRELAWLGEVSGPVRDLDVFLPAMRGYGSELAEADREALAPLLDLLERRRENAQRRFVGLIDSERFRGLVERWRRFVERDDPPEAAPKHAARPIAGLAARRIARAHARVLDRGRRIDAGSKPSRLHRLRIECKKLRYLLEFFRSLFDPRDIGPVVRSLKRLQDCLGEFNDLAVQRATLQELSLQADDGGRPLAAATRAAIERLLERLARDQALQRRRFAGRFAVFDGTDTRRSLARITGSGRAGSESPDASGSLPASNGAE